MGATKLAGEEGKEGEGKEEGGEEKEEGKEGEEGPIMFTGGVIATTIAPPTAAPTTEAETWEQMVQQLEHREVDMEFSFISYTAKDIVGQAPNIDVQTVFTELLAEEFNSEGSSNSQVGE
jgi:hypothetical protein